MNIPAIYHRAESNYCFALDGQNRGFAYQIFQGGCTGQGKRALQQQVRYCPTPVQTAVASSLRRQLVQLLLDRTSSERFETCLRI